MTTLGWESWGVLSLLLLFGELYTHHFVFLWPAVGAAGAAIAAALGLGPEGEILLFVVSSAALLVVARPLFLRILSPEGRAIATNVEALAGRQVEVIEPVGDIYAPGTVRVGGETWTAFTEDGGKLEPGQAAIVARVEGLKLCVRGVPLTGDVWKGKVSS